MVTILLFSCGGSGDGQSSSDGSGYCDCLYIPNETDKKRVVERYDDDGTLEYKLYWDENTNQVVEEEWSGYSQERRTWKCHQQVINTESNDEQIGISQGLGGEYLQEEKIWNSDGVLTRHITYDECGNEIRELSNNDRGELEHKKERHGVKDMYSYYQWVYTGHYYNREERQKYSYYTIYDNNGKLKDSINEIYPDVFPKKVIDNIGLGSLSKGLGSLRKETNYHQNGKIRDESSYLYGMYVGQHLTYNEKGQLTHERNYTLINNDGNIYHVKHGLDETHSDEGVLLESKNMDYGIVTGNYFGDIDVEWETNGMMSDINFGYCYLEGNFIKLEHEYRELNSGLDGLVKFYCGDKDDPRRNLICQINFVNGKPDGEFTVKECYCYGYNSEYYGDIKSEYKYDNGRLLSFKKWEKDVLIQNEVY